MRKGVLAGLLVLLVAGIAMGAYVVATIDSSTTIKESIGVEETKEFAETMYPGETNEWDFTVSNSAKDVEYTITFTLTTFDDQDTDNPNDGKGADIASFKVYDGTNTYDLTADIQGGQATATIPAGGTLTCTLTIETAKDATPGSVTVGMSIARGE